MKCQFCNSESGLLDGEYNEGLICADCATEKNLVICPVCNDIFDRCDTSTTADRVTICDGCYHDATWGCDHCESRFYNDDEDHQVDVPDGYICYTCYENYYRTCYGCDRIVYENDGRWGEDDEFRCRSCHDEYNEDDCDCDSSGILSYSTRISPVFSFGKTELESAYVYGVEVEVDKGGTSGTHARKVVEMMGKHNVIVKGDGSLNNGFEIVSVPGSVQWHREANWEDTFKYLSDNGYRSHNTDTCGLHVHINKKAFGATTQTQDKNIAKMILFYEMNWGALVKFSRRNEESLRRWANRYGIRKSDTPQKLLGKAKCGERYRTVNLCPPKTVEIRMFRGTINHETFIATVEMVDGIMRYTKNHDVDKVQAATLSTIAKYVNSPTLNAYLSARALWDSPQDELPDVRFDIGDWIIVADTPEMRELQESTGQLIINRKLRISEVNGNNIQVTQQHCNRVWLNQAIAKDFEPTVPKFFTGQKVAIVHNPYNVIGYDCLGEIGTIVDVIGDDSEFEMDGRYLVEFDNDYAFLFHETAITEVTTELNVA
jgi:hypothetical protein